MGGDGTRDRDEVPPGVPRPQARCSLRERGGARHRHLHLSLMLHLLDEAEHVQAKIVARGKTSNSLKSEKKPKVPKLSCHRVTRCALLYAIIYLENSLVE